MKLSIVIQAHPERRAEAQHLRRLVGGRVRIVWDPDPDGERCTWRTNRAAWSFEGHGAWTHRLLLQDDVLPCPGFRSAVERAIAAASGEPLLCFFVSEQLPNLVAQMFSAGAQSWAWAPVQGFIPMQALAMPRAYVADMLAWTDEHPHPGLQAQYSWLSRNGLPVDKRLHRRPNDDEIVARWARERGLQVCASVPSLVEHDVWTDSLIGNDANRGRQAACLLPDGVDAATLDW